MTSLLQQIPFLTFFQIIIHNGYWTIFILIFVNYLLYRGYKYKFEIKTYKITNFYITIGCTLLYVSFFILYLILLRALRFGTQLDLIFIFRQLHNFIMANLFNYILSILLIIMFILLWLIIFYRLRNILIYHIKKLHLYLNKQFLISNNYKYYFKFINKIFPKYSYNNCVDNLSNYFYSKCIEIVKNMPSLTSLKTLLAKYVLSGTKLYFIIYYFMFFILVILFFYDCYFNNFIINKVFYYLPIYVIFLLWYNTSFFLYNINGYIEVILFEMYYCEPKIIYVNLSNEDNNELNDYVKNGLQETKKTINLSFLFTHPIINKCRFIIYEINDKICLDNIPENTITYYNLTPNPENGEYFYFDKKDLIVKDGKYFVKEDV